MSDFKKGNIFVQTNTTAAARQAIQPMMIGDKKFISIKKLAIFRNVITHLKIKTF